METIITHTLTAGLSPAHRTRLATAAGLLTSEGLSLKYFFSYIRANESEETEGYTKDAIKTKEFEFVVPDGARPVFITIVQNMDNENGHVEEVNMYDAVTEDHIVGNADGNFPPILPDSRMQSGAFLNMFVGRVMAVLPERKPAPSKGKVKSPEVHVRDTRSQVPINLEHVFAVATKLLREDAREHISQEMFSSIGRSSRRFNGAWSKGKVSKSEKMQLTSA